MQVPIIHGVPILASIHPTAKVSEGTNRNMPTRNTLVQLLALYTNPESHNAQRHRQTDGRQDDANHTVWQYDRIKTKTLYKSIALSLFTA